jgi:hypothetical protein
VQAKHLKRRAARAHDIALSLASAALPLGTIGLTQMWLSFVKAQINVMLHAARSGELK